MGIAENALRQLIDRQAIADIFTAYATALDDQRWADLAALLAPEATALFPTAGVIEGREAIVRLIQRALDRCEATHHLAANHQAEIDGDVATGRCHLRAYHVGAGAFEESLAIFTAHLRRSDESWLITRIVERVPIMRGTKAIFDSPSVRAEA